MAVPTDSEFLKARLAAAAAIPPERRSADVSAFLECYQLEQEVVAAFKAPGYRWQVIDGLKLARADYICLGTPLHGAQLQVLLAPHIPSLSGDQLHALLSNETRLFAWTKILTFIARRPFSTDRAIGRAQQGCGPAAAARDAAAAGAGAG